jgi:hypothetical protein
MWMLKMTLNLVMIKIMEILLVYRLGIVVVDWVVVVVVDLLLTLYILII